MADDISAIKSALAFSKTDGYHESDDSLLRRTHITKKQICFHDA